MNAALFLIIVKMLGFVVPCNINFAVCVDTSGSIWPLDFEEEKKFVEDFYAILTNKSGGDFIHTLAIGFSNNPVTSCNYTDTNDFKSVIQAIKNMKKTDGATYTAECMETVLKTNRPNDYPTLHLVVTDGQATDEEKIPAIRQLLEKNGFFIQAAGFEPVNNAGLLIIAGVEENVIYEKNVADLSQHIDGLLHQICEKMYPCGNKPSIMNAEPLGPQCENAQLGQVCPVVCLPTYMKTSNNPVCVTGGVWQPENICTAICEIEPTVVNGKEEYTEICANKVEGDPCPIECKEGSFFFGKTAICGSDHLWQTVPMCLVIVENDFKSTYWPILLLLVWFVIALCGSSLIIPSVMNKGHMAPLSESMNMPQPEVMDPEINIDVE